MPVFSLDNGRLSPARPSLSHSEEIVRETLMAVRDQVVELIYQPIFPVAWLTETSRNAGRHTSLVAMDPSGKTVTVDVVEELDTSILMGSLARASRHEEIPRGRLSGLYPRGVTAFRKDWQEFLDSCPPGLEDHPRLIILAVTVDEEVRAALDSLVGASIEVHRIDLHESRTGLLVSLDQVRPHEASYLAIGRAVRRGEIAPPASPDEAAEDAPAIDAPVPAASPAESAPEAAEAQSSDSVESGEDFPAQTMDDARDGVVFVSRPGRSASPDPVTSVSTAWESDESVAPAEGGSIESASDSSPAQGGFPTASPAIAEGADAPEDAEPAEATAAVAQPGAVDAATGLGAEPREAEGPSDPVRSEGSGSEVRAERVSEATLAADDDHDRFTFGSVEVSPDQSRSPEEAGWDGEAGPVDRAAVAWPERESELQAVASRVGEQQLTFKSLRRRVNATARLTASGEIILENGDPYTDPDEAATAVAGRRMDGWKNWRTSDGTRLGELRQ